jgi:putative ABC transport system permease protein
MNIRDIAWKNLQRRKAKAAFVLIGLIIGVATVVAVISFSETASHEILNNLEKYGANILILPRTDHLNLSYGGISVGGVSFDTQSIRHSELDRIQSIHNAANLAAVGPVLFGTITVGKSKVVLAGIDFDTTYVLKPWWKIDGQSPGENGVLAGADAQRVLELSVGDDLMINGDTLKVTGILAPTGSQDDQMLFTHLHTAQVLLNKPDQVSIVEVAALCHGCPVDEMVAQIAGQLPSAHVIAIQQVVKSRMEMLSHFKTFSVGLSILVVLAGGLVVLVTLMSSVKERTGEIGIMRAVGFRRSHIMRIILLEAGMISLMAGVLGYLLGVAGIWMGLSIFAVDSVHAIHLNPMLAAGAIGMALVVGLIAGAYPAAMAARMDPNQAFRTI